MRTPVVGSVIRYAYLWAREAAAGRDEAAKDRRPCVVIVATEDGLMMVVPVTHSEPSPDELAVELPQQTKGKRPVRPADR